MMLWSRKSKSKRKQRAGPQRLPQEGGGGWRNRKKWDRLKEAEAKLIEMAKTYYQPPSLNDDDNEEISTAISIEIKTIETPIPYTALPIHEKKKRQKNGQHLYMHSVCAKRRVVPKGNEGGAGDDDSPSIRSLKKSETNVTTDSDDSLVDSPPPSPQLGGSGVEEAPKPVISNASPQQQQVQAGVPLVLLHGYMNGAMYYYRNIANLANHYSEVYSLDLLGCGLSSRRPKLLLKDLKAPAGQKRTSSESTVSMFVEAIEVWRQANNISRMVLGGHSLGGYFAVAYCEKYPQHIQQLQLYSPAGIAHPEWDRIEAYIRDLPFRSRMKTKGARFLFEKGLTPAIVIRGSDKFKRNRGKQIVYDYMKRRIPALPVEEQEALAEYFYRMACIKGTGEYIINRLLTYSSNAKVPLIDRIPNLRIPNVGFLYGISDWMGTDEGVEVMEKCQEKVKELEKQQQDQGGVDDSSGSSSPPRPPTIDVFEVLDAGHLLMLDEWKGFHGAVLALLEQQQQAENVDNNNNTNNNEMLGKNDVVESSSTEELQQQQSSDNCFPKPVRKLEQKHKIRPLYFEKVDHDYEQNAAKAAAASGALDTDDDNNGNQNDSPASAGSLKKFW